MKKGILITTGIVLTLIAAGAALYFTGVYDKIVNPPEVIVEPPTETFEGTIACLPPKNEDAPHTLECAIGLKVDDTTYYGLSGTTDTELSSAAGNERRVKVTGPFQEQDSDKYQMSGIITVKDYSFVE
jgi:hypothetical protein